MTNGFYSALDEIRGSGHHATIVGDFLGPGLISSTIDRRTMELVWSQIIPFPKLSTIANDLPRLKSIISEMHLHYNSYNEFRDAREHLKRGDVAGLKAAIRSGASGVDAIIRFYCKLHSIQFPSKRIPFDQKIELVLQLTGMPSYRAVAPADLDDVGRLYRARNAMHIGDYQYADPSGAEVRVDSKKALNFLEAAERLAIWLDSLA